MTRPLLTLRVLGLVGMVLAVALGRSDLQRPVVAFGAIALAAAVTASAGWAARHRPYLLDEAPIVVAEVVAAAAVHAADGWAYGADWTWHPPALAMLWPLAAMLHAGITFGPAVGGAAGLVVVAGRLVGHLAPDADAGPFLTLDTNDDQPQLLPFVSIVAVHAALGAGAGYVNATIRRTRHAAAAQELKADLARTLHDGVLQVLAVIARRSTDPDISRLARDGEADLRAFLREDFAPEPTNLRAALADACHTLEREHDLAVTFAPDPDLGARPAAVVHAVTGAVTEALTNTAKHAQATRVTVYAAPDTNDRGITVVITDDGCGFDPATTQRRGLRHSIAARIDDIGGNTTIRSTPGTGTEVELWIP